MCYDGMESEWLWCDSKDSGVLRDGTRIEREPVFMGSTDRCRRRVAWRPELVEPGGSGRWAVGEEVTSVGWFARRRPVQENGDEMMRIGGWVWGEDSRRGAVMGGGGWVVVMVVALDSGDGAVHR
ncbi:hypothetical protein RJT34_17905 [Clitoria ternatea]|uniref:Uncharacterized protein n=1 Tax=Clitoria ternatea TaxID=43366 RepID=A0AAN9J9T9_CLITE